MKTNCNYTKRLRQIYCAGLLVTIIAATKAQVATLDSKKIMASIPAMAKLDTLVMAEQQKYVQPYARLRYQTQLSLGIADSLAKTKPTDSLTLHMLQKASTLSQQLQEYETMANNKLQEYKNLLYTPYLEKINNAIKAVALRRKLKQVVDLRQVPLVYTDPTGDITEEVIKELKAR